MERTADQRIHTTEWEDVQYRYGNRVGKYQTHELEILAQQLADRNQNTCLNAYDPHAEKVAAKLERGGYEHDEDGEEEGRSCIVNSDDEDEALAAIRRRRLMELQRQKAMERFGVLRHIPGADYVQEVTEASSMSWVVAALIKPGHSNCEALLTVLRTVAQRHRSVKIVSMIYTEAIQNFPEGLLPCVLLYKDKELRKQITGLGDWQAQKKLSVASVEQILSRNGALPPIEEDEMDATADRDA
ncbi:hypothetical protein, conserved [Leishmania tarentolae]|uniref:Phosducin domain-containing protein n=1 Tax=Leishmania tarentolae TaxID=5689 RepID=A0A640KGN0_LEITA|nr:hypothetical protein, conserved [Leishmania tarentolae]